MSNRNNSSDNCDDAENHESIDNGYGQNRRRDARINRRRNLDSENNLESNGTESNEKDNFRDSDYEIIPKNDKEKLHGKIRNLQDQKSFIDSESTTYAESETSEEQDKKLTGAKKTFNNFKKIFEFKFFYFMVVSFIILMITVFIDKNAEWIFFKVIDPNADPLVYDAFNVNLRKIGYLISILVLASGLISTFFSFTITLIDKYYDITNEYLATFYLIPNDAAYCIVLMVVSLVFTYKGLNRYQLVKETTLDIGHITSTLFLASMIISLKNFCMEKIRTSFTSERYLSRMFSVLRDNYFFHFLKNFKKLKLQNNNLKELTSSISDKELEEIQNKNESRKNENEFLFISENFMYLHDHKEEFKNMTNSSYFYKIGMKKKENKLFDLLFHRKPFDHSINNLSKEKMTIARKQIFTMKTRNPNKDTVRYKWKDRAEDLKNKVESLNIRYISDLRQLFCCEKFFLTWLSNMNFENIVKIGRNIEDLDDISNQQNLNYQELENEYNSDSEPEQNENLGDENQNSDKNNNFDETLNSQDYIMNFTLDNEDKEDKDENESKQSKEKKIEEEKEEKYERGSGIYAKCYENKVLNLKQIMNAPLNESFLEKLLARRDTELYYLNKTIEQNTAAVDKVSYFLSLTIYLIIMSIFLGISLNKADKTIDIISALFGTGFILNSTIKDVISSTVFVFFIKPFDVGDRVFICLESGVENLVVSQLNVLSTTFVKYDGLFVIVPNTILNTKSIINIRRSTLLSESFFVNVKYDTPVQKLELLKYNISLFLRSHPNFYTEFFFFNYHLLEDCNKLTLRIFIQYIENWQEYDRYLERRGMFLSFLNKCLGNLKIRFQKLVQPIVFVNESKKNKSNNE